MSYLLNDFFSVLKGHGLGPLLGIIININLLIVARAFFATTLIVAGFGLVCGACALLMFPRAQYLFLGGPLLSLLFYLITALLCYYFNGEMILFYVTFDYNILKTSQLTSFSYCSFISTWSSPLCVVFCYTTLIASLKSIDWEMTTSRIRRLFSALSLSTFSAYPRRYNVN